MPKEIEITQETDIEIIKERDYTNHAKIHFGFSLSNKSDQSIITNRNLKTGGDSINMRGISDVIVNGIRR